MRWRGWEDGVGRRCRCRLGRWAAIRVARRPRGEEAQGREGRFDGNTPGECGYNSGININDCKIR